MTKQNFMNQWLQHFAPTLSKQQYMQYVSDQYIWHIFSWNLIESNGLLIGNAARQAFNETPKQQCICCDMFDGSGVYNGLPEQYNTAEKIDAELTEFYIVANDYSWTYIKTHEGDSCGPYFFRKTP